MDVRHSSVASLSCSALLVVQSFFKQISSSIPLRDYIIDFAVLDPSCATITSTDSTPSSSSLSTKSKWSVNGIMVIELNPWATTTDS
jgi:hypothetical protein